MNSFSLDIAGNESTQTRSAQISAKANAIRIRRSNPHDFQHLLRFLANVNSRRPSVCLSVVCNVRARALYSGD